MLKMKSGRYLARRPSLSRPHAICEGIREEAGRIRPTDRKTPIAQPKTEEAAW